MRGCLRHPFAVQPAFVDDGKRAPDWAIVEAIGSERTSESDSFGSVVWSRLVSPVFFPSEFLRMYVCAFARKSRNKFELANQLQLELKL